MKKSILWKKKVSFAYSRKRVGNRDQIRLPALWKVCFVFLVLTFTSCTSGVVLLVPEQITRRELSAAQTHTYQFTLEAGQYGRVQIAAPGACITGTLKDANGNLLSDFISSDSDPTIISVVAQTRTTYQLLLLPQVTGKVQINYTVQLNNIRSTNSSDYERLAAESKVIRAAKLKHEWKEVQLRQAIELYGEAQLLWRALQQPLEVAQTSRHIGELYYLLGEKEQASAFYQQALAQYEEQRHLAGQARVHLAFSELRERFEEFSAARTEAEKAQRIGEELGDEAITNEALVAVEESAQKTEYQRMLSRCQTALQYWLRTGNIRQQAQTYFRLGHIYHFVGGDYKNGILSYAQALELSRVLGDRHKEALCLVRIGHIYSLIGEKQQARSSYDKAEVILEQIGDAFGKATFLGGMGFFYEELGDPQRALTYRQKSFAICTKLRLPGPAVMNQMQMARLQRMQGDYQAALGNTRQAYQAALALNDQRLASHTLRDLGLVYEAQGNLAGALSCYQKALALNQPYTQISEDRWKAYALSDLGRLHHRKRQWKQALDLYEQALALNRKAEDGIGQSQTRFYLAQLERDRGNLNAALAQIEQAISFIESLRSKVFSQELRTSYFAAVNQMYELNLALLLQQHRKQPQGNFAAAALSISERARARSLLDLLSESRHDIKQGADPQLVEQERSLRQSLNSKAGRRMELASAPNKATERATVTQEVQEITTQLEAVRSRIRETSPRYAALTQPQPLKAEEIQRLLDDDTLLLEYALGEENSYLWAVTKDSLTAFTLPRRAIIEQLCNEVFVLLTAPAQASNEPLVSTLRRNQQTDRQYWPKAAELSQMVLAPVADQLGTKRLLIVSDGALQRIPFAALPEPAVGGRWSVVGQNQPPATSHQPLILSHELVTLPSASILEVLRQDRARGATASAAQNSRGQTLRKWWGKPDSPLSRNSIAILADPVFERDDKRLSAEAGRGALPPIVSFPLRDVNLADPKLKLARLRETSLEASNIEKAAGAEAFLLKTGVEVNRALLDSGALDRYAIVHFATHGFWDSENPELSALVLSRYDQQGQPQDGFLRLSDIYNLRMPKELVVLSACETAVGKDVRGEGLIALTRGFMYAGAARVLASLWKVEETATVELMKIFYGKLLRERMTAAAALREAQLTMWRQDPTRVPYEWAAFILQGEYK